MLDEIVKAGRPVEEYSFVFSSQPSKGPWTVTLHPYIFDQFMAYCPDRKLRYNAHSAKVSRGSKAQDIYTTVVSHVKDVRQYRLDQVNTC